jgi:L-fuculose-phosphate aldolase
MKKQEILKKLAEYVRLTWDRGLTESTGGNMSVRIGDKVYITPTMFVKHFFTVDDFVELDLNGKQLGGKLKASSEYRMHIKIYNERSDVKSVFHAHPKWATTYSIAHKKVPTRILPETIFMLGEIEYIPYCMPGTDEFADGFVAGLRKGRNAFMLFNHGVSTCGESIEQAFARLETFETCCYISAMAGMIDHEPNQIPEMEVQKFLKKLGLN